MQPGLSKERRKAADPEKNCKGQKTRGFRFRKTISSIISNACGSTRKNGGQTNKCAYEQPKGNMGKILQELERELRGIDENDKKKKGVTTMSMDGKQMEKEEGIGEVELCKKRILMGEKCRPLNSSGVLHYDENGVLVPEDFSSNCNY